MDVREGTYRGMRTTLKIEDLSVLDIKKIEKSMRRYSRMEAEMC